ncbi:MAG TPA: glycosyltransferase family 4 protein [Gemmatirosa sp.]|nr:glycosyltransferase family 4 protein [Gemmatirosa sp.]
MTDAPARAAHPALTVLMTVDAVGGVWTYALELARALGPATRVHVAVLGPGPDAAQRAEAMTVPGLALHHLECALEWMDEPWDDVARAGEWLLSLERALGPDVVHLNGFAHGALPWRAPAVVVAHSCVCSWWEAVHGVPAPAAWDRYRAAVRAGIAAADLVVAPTHAMLDAVRREHGLRAGVVVPNGRDARHFPARAPTPTVLTAGRLWDAAKNVRAVVDAARALPAGWQVTVAGDVAPPEGAHGEARDALPADGAAARVRWLGRLPTPALAAHMAGAAIYALPARYEPFGLSALEAALAGCALVLGDLPSLREVWDDAAWFVPPDDGEALGYALATLAADPPRRAALADAARTRALGYTPARMGDGYRAAYAAAAEARAARRAHRTPVLEVPACV